MTDKELARPKPLRIGMLGTRGVPARYGGFETCVEEIGRRLVDRGHQVTVYSQHDSHTAAGGSTYLGMKIVALPSIRLKAAETLSRSALAAAHAVLHPVDAMFVFNAANVDVARLLRLRRIPFAINVDGMESQRSKWGRLGKRYYRRAEAMAAHSSGVLIADSLGIQTYFREKFQRDAVYIPYGAGGIPASRPELLSPLGLVPRQYHLVVSRLEPENNAHLAVEAMRAASLSHPLVVVGAAPYAAGYVRALRESAAGRDVRFLGAVWDQELLDALYCSSLTYVHGHSVGGTNPSLLRALASGAPTVCYDVIFNREVACGVAEYYRSTAELAELLVKVEASPRCYLERAAAGRAGVAARFDWDVVCDAYEQLAGRLHDGTYRDAPH